jgi:hypothetical protein
VTHGHPSLRSLSHFGHRENRETTKSKMDMWWHWIKNKIKIKNFELLNVSL